MKFRRSSAAFVLALTVAGCSSISRDETYGGDPGSAFLLVVGDGMFVNGRESFTYDFRQIDAAKGTIATDFNTIAFDGMGAIGGDEFAKPDAVQTTMRFGGKRVPAGDYAYTSRLDNDVRGTASETYWNCFSEGAVVFRLQAGAINLVLTGDIRGPRLIDRNAAKARAAAVLATYPKMTAPIIVAEPVGRVTFPTGKSLFGVQTCNPKGTIVFKSKP